MENIPSFLRKKQPEKSPTRSNVVTRLILALGLVIGGKQAIKAIQDLSSDSVPGITVTSVISKTADVIIEPSNKFKDIAFDKVFNDLSDEEKTQVQNSVKEMEKVIKTNPSYQDMLKVVRDNEALIRSSARKYGIAQEIALGIVLIENGGEVDLTSPAGARGPTQLMPDTARAYRLVINDKIDERVDNPPKAFDAMAKYLADLKERFGGNLGFAVWGYHAGEGNVYRALRVYFKDTEGIDLGDIRQDSYEKGEAIKQKYKGKLANSSLNVGRLLSNPEVQRQVISKLEDETELYPSKVAAGAKLFKESTLQTPTLLASR